MNNRLNGLTISMLSLCILGGLASIANAEDPVEMQRYLRKSTSFTFETLGKEIPVNIYYCRFQFNSYVFVVQAASRFGC